ncbi:MAG TPA: ABC transporter ATP-binding protein [Woeseiaceae bacterium]|nr:ABC transporter ATP-binding protein [Woeseiaceae bacterium]
MFSPVTSAIACHDLTIRVPGRTLVEKLDLAVAGGEFVAVLGQNGAGKTRSMHTLAGLLAADSGYVELGGQPLETLRRQEVARRVALLPQYVDDVFPATVMETVLIGRHPHIGPLELESAKDREIASRSLQLVDLEGFAERDIATLSGGERRRVAIAQVLTQSPAVYLLDEPTNHLDPQHQLDVLEVFAAEARNGAAIIANLHDVNLAVRFATRCVLLYGDGRWSSGETSQVLDEQRLTELYGTPMEAVRWRERNIFMATSADSR